MIYLKCACQNKFIIMCLIDNLADSADCGGLYYRCSYRRLNKINLIFKDNLQIRQPPVKTTLIEDNFRKLEISESVLCNRAKL
jgi:hypothetical protein